MNLSSEIQDIDYISPTASRDLVDKYMQQVFEQRIKQAASLHERYAKLWQHAEALFMAGGKRLRPYLTLLCYQLFSEPNHTKLRSIIPAAAAQEFVHLAMLIHDDIIDRDDVRHGIPTIHARYRSEYQSTISQPGERDHFANSTALLAGDVLIAEAMLQTNLTSADRLLSSRLTSTLHQAILIVVGGELLDVESSFMHTDIQNVDVKKIALQKTASYSFVSPMVTGALLAQAPEAVIVEITKLANQLGEAFQLKDDILGMFGDSQSTGKSDASDLIEGKVTLLIQDFYQVASASDRYTFEQAFKNPGATWMQIAAAKALLQTSGALERSQKALLDYEANIKQMTEQLPCSADGQAAIRAVTDMILSRSA